MSASTDRQGDIEESPPWHFEAHNSYHHLAGAEIYSFQRRPARRFASNENNLGEISSRKKQPASSDLNGGDFTANRNARQ